MRAGTVTPCTKQVCHRPGAPLKVYSARRGWLSRYWPRPGQQGNSFGSYGESHLVGGGELSGVGDKFLIGWSTDQRTERLTRKQQQDFDYSMFASRVVHIVRNCCALWPWRTGSASSGWSRGSTILLTRGQRPRDSRRLGALDKAACASKGGLRSSSINCSKKQDLGNTGGFDQDVSVHFSVGTETLSSTSCCPVPDWTVLLVCMQCYVKLFWISQPSRALFLRLFLFRGVIPKIIFLIPRKTCL